MKFPWEATAIVPLSAMTFVVLALAFLSVPPKDKAAAQQRRQPFCLEDGPTDRPYRRLCLDADPDRGGIISYTAHNGARELPLLCNVNGDTQPCGSIGAWTVIHPSGKRDGTDADHINDALQHSDKGVILDGGVFNICQTVNVPRNKTLTGTNVGMYFSGAGNNAVPWPGSASLSPVHCDNIRNFSPAIPTTPNAALVFLHDNTTLQGFAITGFDTVAQGSDLACVSGTNTQGVTLRHMVLANCHTGIRLYSDGSRPGDQGRIVQEFVLVNNTFWWGTNLIDIGTINAGNGCTDFRIQGNELEVPRFAGIAMAGCLGFQVQGNRIEDGNIGIQSSSSQGIISGNHFNNLTTALSFDGVYGLSVANNNMQASNGAGMGNPCIDISGNLTGTNFMGNACLYGYQAVYRWRGGTNTEAKALLLVDNPLSSIGGPSLFFDTATSNALKPFEMTLLVPNKPPAWQP